MKIKIKMEDLKETGKRVLGKGKITDDELKFYRWGNKSKVLKFVVVKGYIADWCIYVESMTDEMSFDDVKDWGNKIHNEEKIKMLVDCDKEVFERYRH